MCVSLQAVCLTALVAQHGNQYLFACMMLAGLIQIAAGQFRLGKFIRLVPNPVMLGFVNGLAIVIGMAQLESFKVSPLPLHTQPLPHSDLLDANANRAE